MDYYKSKKNSQAFKNNCKLAGLSLLDIKQCKYTHDYAGNLMKNYSSEKRNKIMPNTSLNAIRPLYK